MAEAELTEAEREYLEIVKRLVKNNQGHLDGERPLLDRQREFFGVSIEAAARIEQRVLVAYQTFLHRSPSSHPSIPTSTNGIPGDQKQLEREQFDRERRSAYSESLPETQLGASSDDFTDDADDQIEPFTPTYRSPSELPATELPVTELPATALPSTELPSTGLPPTVVKSSPAAAVLQPIPTSLAGLAELERALQRQQWKQADQITLELMLKISGYEAQGWLDAEALSKLSCSSLYQIDRLWRRYSKEKFGFTPQWQVFSKSGRLRPSSSSDEQVRARQRQQPLFSSISPGAADLDYQTMLKFCKTVGWWQTGEFHKYYNQLAFHRYNNLPARALGQDIPQGHLPALWYWKIPWWRALQLGGIGPDRGGCCVDVQTLTAFMQQLQDCEIAPKSDSGDRLSDSNRLPHPRP